MSRFSVNTARVLPASSTRSIGAKPVPGVRPMSRATIITRTAGRPRRIHFANRAPVVRSSSIRQQEVSPAFSKSHAAVSLGSPWSTGGPHMLGAAPPTFELYDSSFREFTEEFKELAMEHQALESSTHHLLAENNAYRICNRTLEAELRALRKGTAEMEKQFLRARNASTGRKVALSDPSLERAAAQLMQSPEIKAIHQQLVELRFMAVLFTAVSISTARMQGGA